MRTIKGDIADAALARTLGFEDRPDALAVWVEYRFNGELVRRDAFLNPDKTIGPDIETKYGPIGASKLRRVVELCDSDTDIAVAEVFYLKETGELVKRSVWVIAKELGHEASAVAASLT